MIFHFSKCYCGRWSACVVDPGCRSFVALPRAIYI